MKNYKLLGWVSALLLAGGIVAVGQEQEQKVEPQKIYRAVKSEAAGSVMPRKVNKAGLVKANSVADAYVGRTFYGGLIYKTSWGNMGITEVPYGVYEFSITDSGVSEVAKYTSMSDEYHSAAYARGHFHGIRAVSMFGSLTDVAYKDIDMGTCTVAKERWVTADGSSATFAHLASAMCYDYTTNTVYAVQYNEDLTGLNWATYNTETQTLEPIGKFSGKFNVLALAASPDGTIYCISDAGDLYTVNKSNGRVSLIGATGVNVAAYTQDAVWDGLYGNLLWSASTATGEALYSVDVTTGAATLIYNYRDGEQVVGMYMLDNAAPDASPAAIDDLSFDYTASGAVSGAITFTVPATTYGNASLGGNVDVKVWFNGEQIKDDAVAAGTAVTLPVDFVEGNNYVAVTLGNETGFGPMNSLYAYAGYDYPLAVGDLAFEVTEGVSKVTWTAPAGGQNGGYIDADKLYYQVVRQPDNVVVADNLKATEFSEQLPAAMHKYSYQVTAYNGGDKKGVTVETEKIMYGEAYEAPYSYNFLESKVAEEFMTFDLDGDGYTWALDWNYAMGANVTYNADANNDWLLLPVMQLEAGYVYRFTPKMRSTFNSMSEKIRFAVGTEATAEALADYTEIYRNEEYIVPSGNYENLPVNFTVPTTGKYYIALNYFNDKSTGSGVKIESLAVTMVGNANAPAAVSSLEIIPDENDALKATVKFNAPAENLAGEAISKVTGVKIYRNGDMTAPVHTTGELVAGAEYSWTDENVPAMGYNTYTVVAENESGAGDAAESTAFVGVYTAPYKNWLDSQNDVDAFEVTFVGFEEPNLKNVVSYSTWQGCMNMYRFNTGTDPIEIYAALPKIKFDDESVYRLSFKYSNSNTNESSVYDVLMGASSAPEDLTRTVMTLPNNVGYSMTMQESEFVVEQGGKMNIAWHALSNVQWDMISVNIDSIEVNYVASAKAPYIVTDYKSEPNANGELKSSLSFKAPVVDYAQRTLSSISKIEIYRGESVIPVKTFEAPAPGEQLSWEDETAVAGYNVYMIVPSNEYGRGKAFTDTIFVGYDTPVAVSDLSIVPSADNQTATITWTAPTAGVNGGVIDTDHLAYKVLRYYPDETDESKQIEILATVDGTSCTPERTPTDEQELCYYGVCAMTETPAEGGSVTRIADSSIYFTILGKLYELPFVESFANGEASTKQWLSLTGNSYSLSCGATVGDGGMSNYSVEPQDGDNGGFYFYNGAYYETPSNIGVITPKVNVKGCENATLSFWLYKGNQCGYYSNNPSLSIQASLDETIFYNVANIAWTETEKGWVKYTYDLKDFTNIEGGLFFSITASLSGYNDIIFMDNFRIDTTSGVDSIADDSVVAVYGVHGGVLTRGAAGKMMRIYSTSGALVTEKVATDEVENMTAGVYVVEIDGKSYKVAVK